MKVSGDEKKKSRARSPPLRQLVAAIVTAERDRNVFVDEGV